MKILVVTQYFWPENFRINDLTAALMDRGHEVTVLTGMPNYPGGSLFDGYGWFFDAEASAACNQQKLAEEGTRSATVERETIRNAR